MELKVWVEGIQRIVCGVTDVTTCQDVVYALAHATGKTGRFTLMERWRNSERLLAPHEHPLKILLKWGEYSSDVQFILQRTALEPKTGLRTQGQLPPQRSIQPVPGGPQRIGGSSPHKGVVTPSQESPSSKAAPQSPVQSRDIKKSLTFSGGHSAPLGPGPPEVGSYPPQGGFLSPIYHPNPSSPLLDPTAGATLTRINQHQPSMPPRHPFSGNRPPAPPPYELVRGHPPPPPPTGGRPPPPPPVTSGGRPPPPGPQFHSAPSSAFGPYSPQTMGRGGRSPVPFPSRGAFCRPTRELPPYRDPPPPPPPSHPALMKIATPKSPPSEGMGAVPAPPLDERKFGGASVRVSDAIVVPLNSSAEEKTYSKHKAQRSGRGTDKAKRDEARKSKEKDSIPTPDSTQIPPTEDRGPSPIPALTGKHYPASLPQNNINDKDTPQQLELDNKRVENNDFKSAVLINKSYKEGGVAVNRNLKEGGVALNKNLKEGGMALNRNLKEGGVALNKNIKEGGGVSDSEGGDKGVVQSIIKQLVKSSVANNHSHNHNSDNHSVNHDLSHPTEEVVVDSYYRDLVKLVNQQRERISAQQIDLTKYEAEITFTEGRWKEEESRLAFLKDEIQRLEKIPDKTMDLNHYLQLEEQLNAAKVSESSSKEDIANIQKRIDACDQQLTQMANRIRSIENSIRQEELTQKQKAEELFQEEEQDALLREIDRLKEAVQQAATQAQHTQDISHQLASEMSEAENRLEEKRKEIENLKQAMREANLEALSMNPHEEGKGVSESKVGNGKSGTNRRMVGSPRQLETAVPTSKNPHGVWV